jgi:hypothetical protein
MGWWFALTIGLYTDALALADTYREERSVAADRDSKTGSDKITAIIEANKCFLAIKKKRRDIYINFVKNGADWFVSAQGFQLPQKVYTHASLPVVLYWDDNSLCCLCLRVNFNSWAYNH